MTSPMPEELTTEQLLEQEKALEKQLALVRTQRAEAQRKQNELALIALKNKELTKPIEVKIVSLVSGNILVENDYREDVVALLRTVPGRSYRGHKENMIPLNEWGGFEAKLKELPNVKILIADGVKKEMEWYLTAPTWNIELGKRQIECFAGPRAATHIVYNIPGAAWDAKRKMMQVPMSEGYKLYESLQDVEGVVWSDAASKFVIDQIDRRGRLDQIATMERGDKYRDFQMGEIKLRPFQEVGCEFVDATGGRALVGYEMGLGKTIIALAYAVKNNLRTVVICPASLKPNWAREVYKCTGTRAVVYSGGEPTQHDLVMALTKPPQYAIINYDIVGRKAEIKDKKLDEEGYVHEANQTRFFWVELINMMKPDLVIVDEGHYIKNMDSNRSKAVRQIKCPRVLCMTGTPVLNRPGELYPMLALLAPEQFPAYETFLTQYTRDGRTAKNVDELRSVLRTVMIRRLKKDVVKDLPPINRMNKYHELSPKAQRIYERIEQGVYEMVAEYDAKGQSREMSVTNILVQIGRMKQVCAIDKVEDTADLATELYDQTDESEDRKVLIFSQYKAVAYAIYQRLADQGALCFVRRGEDSFITADNNERDALVQQFQNDPSIKYLIVTEKTAKEGHNITAAGHVIFNDLFWTPAAHEQGEGRAYGRLSDLHTISSYYMITDMDGEGIEEWIMELLASKMAMINEVVEGVEGSRDSSIAMELIQKMKEKMWTRK
jgi:SNF2 family DNA or RNA helicase